MSQWNNALLYFYLHFTDLVETKTLQHGAVNTLNSSCRHIEHTDRTSPVWYKSTVSCLQRAVGGVAGSGTRRARAVINTWWRPLIALPECQATNVTFFKCSDRPKTKSAPVFVFVSCGEINRRDERRYSDAVRTPKTLWKLSKTMKRWRGCQQIDSIQVRCTSAL